MSSKKKLQTNYILLTILVCISGGGTTFPLVFGINFYPFGAIGGALIPIIITYAIIKHKLLDIPLAISITIGRMMTYLTLIIAFAFGHLFLTGKYLPDNSLYLIFGILFLIIACESYSYIRSQMQEMLDNILVKARKRDQKVIKLFNQNVDKATSIEELSEFMVQFMDDIINAKLVNFWVDRSFKKISNKNKKTNNIINKKAADNYSYFSIIGKRSINIESKKEFIEDLVKSKTVIERPKLPIGLQRANSVLVPFICSDVLMGFMVVYLKDKTAFNHRHFEIFDSLINQIGLILDRIKAYKKISDQKEEFLREKVELTKSLAGSIAHEVRNPLNVISMISDQIEDNIRALELGRDDKCRQELEKLNQLVTKSINRTNQVIDMTLSDLRGEEIDKSKFVVLSARKVIENALQEYGFASDEERKRVSFVQNNTLLCQNNTDQTLNNPNFSQNNTVSSNNVSKSDNNITDNKTENNDFHFKGDETQFIYVLFNLIKNALYYLKEYPQSNITIEVVKAGFAGGNNQIIVTDTGPGIPSDKLETIFNSFETIGKTGGTGLGLPFCRRVMKSFGGDIICESEIGKYTKFIMSFPILDENALKNNANLLAKRLLIIDDQKVNLEITKNIIEKNLNHLICDLAIDSDEALKLFKENKPNIILMDLQMPEIDGFKTTQKIRKLDQNIPIIAYTSKISKEIIQKIHAVKMDSYIIKPISHDILVKTISNWLRDDYKFNFTDQQIATILKGKKVICADDQPLNNMILEKNLKSKFELDIDLVENGADLVKKFKSKAKTKNQYDLILTDINMNPGINGMQAAREIRDFELENKIGFKTPIIAITGDDDKELVYNFYRNGMDDYYKKGNSNQNLLYNLMAFWIRERNKNRFYEESLIANDNQDQDLDLEKQNSEQNLKQNKNEISTSEQIMSGNTSLL